MWQNESFKSSRLISSYVNGLAALHTKLYAIDQYHKFESEFAASKKGGQRRLYQLHRSGIQA